LHLLLFGIIFAIMHTEALYQIYKQHPIIATDTRKISIGAIFFALKGDNFNGNQFALQALKQGAAFAIVDESIYEANEKIIVVDDVLIALQQLAKYHRMQFMERNIPFLAITGSNGKTTTKELIHAVISTTYNTYYTHGNLNNHIGVPLTLLSIKDDVEFAIIEMGANHQKEIAAYCEWALPTHVLINNCGKAHLEGFGGIEGVRKGKGELYDYAAANNAIVFRNTDLIYLKEMAMERNINNEITYGSQDAKYIGKAIDNNGMIDVAVLTSGYEALIKTNLVGSYNFDNIIGAIAVGATFNVPMNAMIKALENYNPTNSRSQLIQQNTNTIILDAYNANPTSMTAAIRNFMRTSYSNKVLMLGGMWELGEESLPEHQTIINLINESNWNAVILVGGDFKNVKHNYIYFENNIAAKEWLIKQQYVNTAILIKGSRATAMEKVLEE
jgi:UDP-N-acetylmuramoyl-tripeptide--D-alanyl-D-alanine ligase